MSKINIHGKIDNSDDSYFRYQMDKLIIGKEKEFTTIPNIDQIAKDLHRDTQMLIKYLKKRLGIAILYKNNKAMMTKQISQNELQNYIYDFIEENILCKKCQNPETELIIEKKKTFIECKACSYKFDI